MLKKNGRKKKGCANEKKEGNGARTTRDEEGKI